VRRLICFLFFIFYFFSCSYELQFLIVGWVKFLRFIPPEDFNLALLTLELEFVKKGTKNEQASRLEVLIF